jgi:hypothetical protein
MFVGTDAGADFLAPTWHHTELATINIQPLRGSAGEIGNMLAVKVRYRQGVASQSGSESWGG